MNIALILQHKLLQGLQSFLSGSTPRAAMQPLPCAVSHARPVPPATPCPATVRFGTPVAPVNRYPTNKVMPLRVLRVVDSGMPRSSTGRLVISGRMADVCAELDRLVEREAALH